MPCFTHSGLRHWLARGTTCLWLLLTPLWAVSAELIVNGSFETHGGAGSTSFTGWTQVSQSGSGGAFYAQSGALTQVAHFVVPLAPLGSYAAVTDQIGPGSQALYQDVSLSAASLITLSMRLMVYNQANSFASPANLDYQSVPNQQVRVDVVSVSAPSFDVGSGVLSNLYRSQPGQSLNQGYVTIAADLSAFAGQQVRLRIASVDNLGGLNVGVDNVSILTTPLTTPGAPGIASVSVGPGLAVFTLTPPVDTGGGPIVHYGVSCSASGHPTVTGASTIATVTVAPLQVGVRYSCTATASNAAFTSPSSAANVIAVTNPLDITPILMLMLLD